MKQDLENMRKTCEECQYNHPSQPKEKPTTPTLPDYPFQNINSDYFFLEGKVYLLIVDAFTSWPIVYAAKRGGTADELKEKLQECFSTYGIPENLTSDGGPQYTSHIVRDFLASWGVKHRICSAYNPHSNMRAETGVKSMKRILREAITRHDGLDGERARIAVMEYRNTPLRDLKRSPAQLLLSLIHI